MIYTVFQSVHGHNSTSYESNGHNSTSYESQFRGQLLYLDFLATIKVGLGLEQVTD